MSEVKGSSSALMVMDVMISESDKENFFEIDTGGVGAWGFDNSNHPTNKKFANTGYKIPDGSNVGFVDGHVSWRDFEVMESQVYSGNVVWFWW